MRKTTLLCCLAAMLAGALAYAAPKAGRGKDQRGPETDLPVFVLDAGEFSGVTAAARLVVRDEATWDAVWQAHRPGTEPPVVDFADEMVLAVFLGFRPTPNHSVTVDGVREGDDLVTADVTEHRPGSNCVLPDLVTTPYTIVIVPARTKTVEFDLRVKRARRCGH